MRWSRMAIAVLAVCAGRVGTIAAEPAAEAPNAAVQELNALAAKTDLPVPFRIVCLGDSITAVPAGRTDLKYPQLLQTALAARYGDKVEVVNAGRGGDSVVSALKRLETDAIAKDPTLVFINLGVNDSKLAQPDHTRNVVPLDKFTEGYREIVKTIQEKTKARVVAVGTIACVDEWTRHAAMGREKKGNYFGKPEELKKFNAAAQEVAKELGCDYVDLFDHFMAQPDLKALFREPDGVHCRERGQEQIALQLMRYLAKTWPAK